MGGAFLLPKKHPPLDGVMKTLLFHDFLGYCIYTNKNEETV